MVCQRRDRIVRCRVWASLALLALGGSGPGHTEEPKHLGVASCASSVCHGRVEASEKHNALMTEYSVWFRHDRHARAYETLSSPLSKRIASNLGLVDASSAEGIFGVTEEHENIRVFSVPTQHAFDLFDQGLIINAMSIITLQWLRANLGRVKGECRA